MSGVSLARILPLIKKDWLSGIANLFLFNVLFCVSGFAYGHDTGPGDSLQPDSLPLIVFTDYAPLLAGINPDSSLPGKAIEKIQFNWLDSTLMATLASRDSIKEIRPFFYPHNLKIDDYQIVKPLWHGKEIEFAILLLAFIFLAAAQFYYGKRFLQIFRAGINSRFLAQLVRNGDLYNEQISVYLFLIYLLCLPLMLLEINLYYLGIEIPAGPLGVVTSYLLIFGIYALLYGFKILAIRFSGIIFKTDSSTQDYILILFVFNLIEGVVLLIFLCGIIFAESDLLLRISLFILGLLFLYRLLRSFLLGLTESKYSIFYLFLFFCTIEVLPLLILYKLLMNFFRA